MRPFALLFVFLFSLRGQGSLQTVVLPEKGAVARTAQDKFAEHVSILDFGGAGDGSTDNLAAYNAAYAAVVSGGGGRIFFPKGDYHFSAAVVIQDPGVEIECESHYLTFHFPTMGARITGDSLTDDVVRVQPSSKDITGGAIRNCHIEQNPSATSGNGIHLLAPASPAYQIRNFDLDWDTVGKVAQDGVAVEGYRYPGSGAIPSQVNVAWRISQDHITVLTAGRHCFSYVGWVEQVDAIRPYCGGARHDAFHLDSVGFPAGTAPLAYSMTLEAPTTASVGGYPFYINATQGVHITDPYNDDFAGPAYAYLNNTYGVKFDGVAHGGIHGTQLGFDFHGANYGTSIDLPFWQALSSHKPLTLEAGATVSGLSLYYKGGSAGLGQVPFYATDWDTGAPPSVGAVSYPGAMAEPFVPNVTTWAITNPSAGDSLMRAVSRSGVYKSGFETANPTVSTSPMFGLYSYAPAHRGRNVFGEAVAAQQNILASLLRTPLKIGTTDPVPLDIYTAGLSRVRFDHTGNVGIGNQNPSAKLHVSGQILADNALPLLDTKSFLLRDASGNYAIGMAATSTGPYMQFDTGTSSSGADGYNFRVNGVNQVALRGDGRHVIHSAGGLVTLAAPKAAEFAIQTSDVLGSKSAYLSIWDANGRQWLLGTGNPLATDTSFTISEYNSGSFVSSNAHFRKGGNIGFGRGNTSPRSTVHIYDATASTGTTQETIQAGAGNASSDIAWQLLNNSGGQTAYIRYDGSTNLAPSRLPSVGKPGTYTKVTTDAAGRVTAAAAADLSGSDVTGILASARFPALTGDATTSSGSVATTVRAIQSVEVDSKTPADGQVLQYSSRAGKWEPTTPSAAQLAGAPALAHQVAMSLPNQSAAIGPTNLRPGGRIAARGLWNIDFYFVTRTTGTAGKGIFSVIAPDNVRSRTFSFEIDLTTNSIGTSIAHGRVTVYTTGASDIQYSVALPGAGGNPTYDLFLNLQDY